MTRSIPWRWCLAGALTLLVAGCGNKDSTLDPTAPDPAATTDSPEVAGGIPLSAAEVFFEFNSTDNDLGFQVKLDGEDWNRMRLGSPNRQTILDIRATHELGDLGLTELRFESAEPSPAEVLAIFEPGQYTFRGRTTEGDALFGTGTLSHDILPAAVFSPSNGEAVDPVNTVMRWDAVPGAESYEVIVSDADNGFSMELEVPGHVRELHVPPTFMSAGTNYKAEVLAVAGSGNKTITEGTFRTLP